MRVNTENSIWHPVLSGIPQGSVLGPILFVIYINTLPTVASVGTEIVLFADDTKAYRMINNQEDCEQLQEDIDAMFEWTENSLLKFHPDKCAQMRLGKSKESKHTYVMGPQKQPLKNSSCEKDIGVFVDEELSFDEHIANKVNKANSVMGMIRRTFDYLDKTIFLLLYKALVRPHIEYANQVWAPALKKHKLMIENVQRRATKQLQGFKDLSYEDRLKELNLPTLTYRRHRGDMIEMFKILTKKYDEKVCDFVPLANTSTYNIRGHKYKVEKRRSKTKLKQNSFINRSVDLWNSLPDYVVSAETVKSFEARLDKHWSNADFKYNWEANPPTQKQNRELTLEDPPVLQSEEDL